MAGLQIPCPKCGKKLKLPDRNMLGRKGKCPKCAHSFVLEEPDEAHERRNSGVELPTREPLRHVTDEEVLALEHAPRDEAAFLPAQIHLVPYE